MDSPARRVSLARWVITLGGAGFLSGFIGPIVLNPDANQGPLLGLFITGPGGALAGLVLGVLFRSLPISDLRRLQACWFACAAISLTTLYICLPSPALLGYVIDAQVERCAPLRDFENDALAEWDAAVARAPGPGDPPREWPPTDPPDFLSLQILGSVPEEFRPLLR